MRSTLGREPLRMTLHTSLKITPGSCTPGQRSCPSIAGHVHTEESLSLSDVRGRWETRTRGGEKNRALDENKLAFAFRQQRALAAHTHTYSENSWRTHTYFVCHAVQPFFFLFVFTSPCLSSGYSRVVRGKREVSLLCGATEATTSRMTCLAQ